jgi:hypothetical protein
MQVSSSGLTLNSAHHGPNLEISKDKLTAQYVGEARHSSDVGVVQATQACPLDQDVRATPQATCSRRRAAGHDQGPPCRPRPAARAPHLSEGAPPPLPTPRRRQPPAAAPAGRFAGLLL